jgi:hypothetical protein
MEYNNPAKTYTLTDFIGMKDVDETTYRNFSILEKINGIEFVDHNLLDEYKEYIYPLAVETELTDEEYKKYKYAPDLLAYDIYGSTQLDYFILFVNNMIDPKDFNKKKIKMIHTSVVRILLNEIMSANRGYIEQNRQDQNIVS